MKVAEVRWLLLILFAGALVISFKGSVPTMGVSAEWKNGEYLFSGGTHPLGLLLAAIGAGLYLLLMFAEPAAIVATLPGLFRRFAAFWIDFLLAMTIVTPIFGILPVLSEWRRTGEFAWTIERTEYVKGDLLLSLLGLLLASAALFFYFLFPLLKVKPSPGACILGYQIVSDSGVPLRFWMAVARCALGFVAVAAWYIAFFVARDKVHGKFWLDRVFATHAAKFR
ncbi:MAG TPA: RDD family protein [Candidatus Acidoferrum sp.]|nr:RDD family protein [Candidatus Acidoferrum sp.]